MSRNVYRNIVSPERYFILSKTANGRASGIEIIQLKDNGRIAMLEGSEESIEDFMPPNGRWKHIGDVDVACVLYNTIQETLLQDEY